MSIIIHFLSLIFYQPPLNALVFFYNTVAFGDVGLAIIFLTILIRLLLFPLFHKSVKHQMVMQRLQPRIEKINREHKDDKEKKLKATMELYQEHNINPFSGFLLLLVQLPILFSLFKIFSEKLTPEIFNGLYSFVQAPKILNYSLFGLINLEERSTVIVMVGLAALLQYIQGKMSLPKIESGRELSSAEKISRQMVFMAPLITLVIFFNLPAAVSLYWVVSSLFSIFQQEAVNRQLKQPIYEESGNSRKKNNRVDGV